MKPFPRDRGSGPEVRGKVMEALPNAMFEVQSDLGLKITAHITGSVRTRLVRVVPGDRVVVELSPYDPSRGRITQVER